MYGSRITGGGFGGCSVTLVERSAVGALEKALKDNFFKQTKQRCDCYECLPSAGAGVLDLTPHLARPYPTASTGVKGSGKGRGRTPAPPSATAAPTEDSVHGGISSTVLDYALPIAVTVMVAAVTVGALMAWRRAK